jgi:hypothetical protein
MTVRELHQNKLEHLETLLLSPCNEINHREYEAGIKKQQEILATATNLDEEIKYGIYNTVTRKFCFGINETSKTAAMRKLFMLIGKDSYKWRWEAREICRRHTSDKG